MKPTDEKMLVQMTIADLRELIHQEVKAAIVNHQPKPKLTFTTEEAAAILNVPESWLATAARQGQIRSVKLGHYVRFRLVDIEHFIQKQSERKAS